MNSIYTEICGIISHRQPGICRGSRAYIKTIPTQNQAKADNALGTLFFVEMILTATVVRDCKSSL